ncbi:MAG: amidohydrolase [Deltaproteobacteria bacterium]|nr:amidohydrolase [Deltaproteobacteria bacterium]
MNGGKSNTSRAGKNPADLVLQNAAVYTVYPSRPWADSLAVKGKEIVYVGSNTGVGAYIGQGTEVIDLHGKMVLPGFVDSHAHVSLGVSLVPSVSVQLFNLPSLAAYQQALRDFAARRPDLEVIYGAGWTNSIFPPLGPRKEDLDAVVADRPVSMMSEDGHAVWVNSKALEAAGIGKGTPDPRGGVIERDPETGEPSGTLLETAMDSVHSILPPYTVEQMKEGIRAYAAMAAREGITTVHDPMLICPGDRESYLASGLARNSVEAFSQLEAHGELSLRVRGSLLTLPTRGPAQVSAFLSERAKHRGAQFQINSAKIFADGVIEGSTAYLFEPYAHMPEYRGKNLWEPDALKEICRVLDREKFQIHVHAIGDAAISMTLDAFEHARKANGPRDSRHLITHLQLLGPKDIPRFASLWVIGVPQPIWFLKGDYYYKLALPYLGRERADRQYPMKSFFEAGVRMAGASDFPVTLPCPPPLRSTARTPISSKGKQARSR